MTASYHQRFKSTEERFNEKVDFKGPTMDHMSTSCYVWTGSSLRQGYGRFYIQGKLYLAHRVAWQSIAGDIPPGLQVLHECDNPACVRPSHLWLGRNEDNVADKVRKGRQYCPRGQSNPKARLTPALVLELRTLWRDTDATVKELARRFGLGTSATHAAATGKSWTHVEEE